MIIKCLKNGELALTAKRLTELTKYIAAPYYVDLKDWYENPDTFKIVHTIQNKGFHPANEGGLSIGCRHFPKSEYAKIVRAAEKAAGVRKPKPAKKAAKKSTKKGKR